MATWRSTGGGPGRPARTTPYHPPFPKCYLQQRSLMNQLGISGFLGGRGSQQRRGPAPAPAPAAPPPETVRLGQHEPGTSTMHALCSAPPALSPSAPAPHTRPTAQPVAPHAVDAGSGSGGVGEEEGEGEGRAGAKRTGSCAGRVQGAQTKQQGINAVPEPDREHFTFTGHGMLKCITCSWVSKGKDVVVDLSRMAYLMSHLGLKNGGLCKSQQQEVNEGKEALCAAPLECCCLRESPGASG
eukprot:scaffold58413_cov18-Tisochrysis_lutea.AAC.5